MKIFEKKPNFNSSFVNKIGLNYFSIFEFSSFRKQMKQSLKKYRTICLSGGVDEYVGIFSFLALENYSNLCGTYQVTRAELNRRTEASK